jgi:hypothetical protein
VSNTYLTTEELSSRIKYDDRTIRERLLDSVLIEGVHYIRPFGGRKILYIWEQIEKDMAMASLGSELSPRTSPAEDDFAIPMANGGVCRLPSGANAATQRRSKIIRAKEMCHG